MTAFHSFHFISFSELLKLHNVRWDSLQSWGRAQPWVGTNTPQGTHTHKSTLTAVPYGANSESPINLYFMLLDCGRKRDHLEETHANTGKAQRTPHRKVSPPVRGLYQATVSDQSPLRYFVVNIACKIETNYWSAYCQYKIVIALKAS